MRSTQCEAFKKPLYPQCWVPFCKFVMLWPWPLWLNKMALRETTSPPRKYQTLISCWEKWQHVCERMCVRDNGQIPNHALPYCFFPLCVIITQLSRTRVIYRVACCIIPVITFSSAQERFHLICQVCSHLAATLAAWWAGRACVGKLPRQGERRFQLSCKTDAPTDNSPAISYTFSFIQEL